MEMIQELEAERRRRWRQTPESRIPDAATAAQFIERVGLATPFPVSPEVPNLFHAYVGDAGAKTDSGHDSPSGEVYTWRWVLGRRDAAFYCALVRGRPTWASWNLFPAVLRLWGEERMPDELFDRGVLSADAYRIVCALEAAGGELSTGELRQQANFPTGKTQRAAYLKAIDELDARLILAKVFAPEDDATDMRHALVYRRFPQPVAAADRLSRAEALATFLETYLPMAVYVAPVALARHLKLPEPELRQGLDRLVSAGQATTLNIPSQKLPYYRWQGDTALARK